MAEQKAAEDSQQQLQQQQQQEAPALPPPTASGLPRREPLVLSDDTVFPLDFFHVPAHYADTLSSILIPHGMILDRVEKLAEDIKGDFAGQAVHLLCVLKGGSVFFQDLCRVLHKFHTYSHETGCLPYTFDFIRVKSYEGTESSGKVQIWGTDLDKLRGKNVVIVEDIIDTGITMTNLLRTLREHGGIDTIRVATLLEKRISTPAPIQGDYVGFSIPDKFVVGYALDYNEGYRDMLHIGVINEAGIARFRDGV